MQNTTTKRVDLLDENAQRLRTYHTEKMEPVFADRKDLPSYRVFKAKYAKKAKIGLERIEKNYNDSWYNVLKSRWDGHMDEEAIFYRGASIPGKKIFREGDRVAAALKYYGIQKGDEIGCCITNCPDLIYLMLGANRIGAKLNFFGAAYNREYIKQIIADCDHKLMFITDDLYPEIADIVEKTEVHNIVLLSLSDDLPQEPEKCPQYIPSLDQYYRYQDKASVYAQEHENYLTFNQFLKQGEQYNGTIDEKCELDTEFLVTYTSGSTKIGFPKRMIHKNRGLITDGVFHDEDLCSNPAVPDFTTMAYIHTDTATDLISIISNALMQRWTLQLEPECNQKFFLDSLFMDRPNYICAPTNFFLEAAKQYLIEKRYHREDGSPIPLDFLLVAFAVGEGCLPGEERFINEFLKQSKAGSSVKIKGSFTLPYTTLGLAGGDTEHGGIFYVVMKRLTEMSHLFRLHGKPYGMDPLPYVQSAVLRKNKDGTYTEVGYNEPGIIVANSPITMAGYREFQKTKDKVITDDRGIDWVSCDVFGYIDKLGSVHMKDRVDNEVVMEDGTVVVPYNINDVVQKDPANIMTSMITPVTVDGKTRFVINYECSPIHKHSREKILLDLNRRIAKSFPELSGRILYRIFDEAHPFPLTASGKRSIVAVEKMGTQNARTAEAHLAHQS